MDDDKSTEVVAREHASVAGMSDHWSGERGSDAITSDKHVVGNEAERLDRSSEDVLAVRHKEKNSEPCDARYYSSQCDQEAAAVATPAGKEPPPAVKDKDRADEPAFSKSTIGAVEGAEMRAGSKGGCRDWKAGTASENCDIQSATVEAAVGNSHIGMKRKAETVEIDNTDSRGKRAALHGLNRRAEVTGDGGDNADSKEATTAAIEVSDAVQLVRPPAVENDDRDEEVKSAVQDSDPDNKTEGAAAVPTVLDDSNTNAVANDNTDRETSTAAVAQNDSDAEEEPECRVCRGDDEGGTRPLANPCACSGSVKFVHQVRATFHGDALPTPLDGPGEYTHNQSKQRVASSNPERFGVCEQKM